VRDYCILSKFVAIEAPPCNFDGKNNLKKLLKKFLNWSCKEAPTILLIKTHFSNYD
jgi:hypothetical protein